jgi:hypothetical protein
VIKGNGVCIGKASAALITPPTFDTQQVAVDNALILSMRCANGITNTPGSAIIA